MSNTTSLFVKAMPAGDLVARFAAAAPIAFPTDAVHFAVTTNVQGIGLDTLLSAVEAPANAAITEFVRSVDKRSYVVASQIRMQLQQNGNIFIRYESDDGIVGRLTVQSLGDQARALRMLDAIEKHFNVTSYVDLVRATSPVVDHSAITMRERSVADLQAAVEKLSEFLATLAIRETENRQRLEKEQSESYQKRVDALDQDYRDRQSKLDKQRQSTEDEFSKRERDFQERVGQFETKESKYMRRELLKQIEKALKDAEQAALSEPTGRKRAWVHGFVWLLLAVSGALAVTMGYQVFRATEPDWHRLAPMTGGFLTFVLTTVYYLKWNDRWFREHADAEFAAKRYKADILRASWVAELVAEWAKEGKGDMSPDLLAAYTRNLFRDVVASRVSEHPMDHLTSIMKRATEFDIGKGVFSVRGYKPEAKAKVD